MAVGTATGRPIGGRSHEVFHTYRDMAMFNNSKHSGSKRSRVASLTAAAALVLSLPLGSAAPAAAASAPPESPGCETYGCLYEHCPTHVNRRGDNSCKYGVAYERLPDGPDNRRYVKTLWPENYDSDRRHMWDQVAYCESTWRWDINNGNGFHGGVQFHPNTWRFYGGEQYAPNAWQATPEQQISIAERVAYYGYTRADGTHINPQGPGAWPRCGRYLSRPAA